MTNEKRLQDGERMELEPLKYSDGTVVYGSKSFKLGFKAGFHKALNLLMQLAKEEYGDEVISFEHIVNKLRGDNERV